MNILVFSWRDPKHPLAGGAEQVMHEHMKGWIAAGHAVTLLASRIENTPENEIVDGIRIIRRGYHYLGVQLAGLSYYLSNRNTVDFLVDQFHGIPFFTPLYSRKPRVAVLQEVAHEVWFKNPFVWPLNWIVGVIGYVSEFFILQLYRWTPFMVGSASAKKDLVKTGISSSSITIIPHGVIVDYPRVVPSKEKTKTIVFLGALEKKNKGIDDALKTFSLLGTGYQFWAIGKVNKKLLASLLKKSQSLGIRDQIKFWGFVSDKQKFVILAKAHVLINPSILEGWGLVNIEANAMGTPVVAYRSAGLVDSVKNNYSGILLNTNTPREMAAVVSDLLNNRKMLDKLSENAKQWSKRFDWKKSQKMSLDLLEKIA